MHYTTTVKVCAADQTDRVFAGVRVALYDRDTFTPDDLIGSGTTDENGEARFDYGSDKFVDLDDRLTGVFPDLYVVVYDAGGNKVHSSRAETEANMPRKHVPVFLSADEAERVRAVAS